MTMNAGNWTHEESRDGRCLSDLALDKMLTGELQRNAALLEHQRAHLRLCAACTQRLARIEADAAHLLAERPRLPTAAGVTSGFWRRHRQDRARRSPGMATAALGVLAVMGIVLLAVAGRSPDGRDWRSKGGSSPVNLELLVKRTDERVESLLPNGTISPGDALRFRISTARGGELALVSIDGTGLVSRYAPRGGPLTAVMPGRPQLLEGSIVVDDHLGRERIIAFVCARPLDSQQVLEAVRRVPENARGGPEPVPVSLECEQSSFWFSKVAPP